MKRILFYSTPSDIKELLGWLEGDFPIAYIPFGASGTQEVSPLLSFNEIENLGMADHDQTSACRSYLVFQRGQSISPMSFVQEDGSILYSFTQMGNENTIVFRPAGMWTNEICLHGEISTIHDTQISKNLMKLFYKNFSKRFKKVKSFWIGPQAYEMLKAGRRLTMAVQSPPEYNLSEY